MKKLLLSLLVFIAIYSCGSDPYSEGMHWDYSISCQEGFIYKHLSHNKGTIPVLNSDGSHLRCGNKKY